MERIRNHSAVNLDTGTLRALASGDPALVAQITTAIAGRDMLATTTAVTEFVASALRNGGANELMASAAVLHQISQIPDMPSARVLALTETRSIGAADKLIFGTGDQLRIQTFTSDAKFVRGASAQGVNLNVYVHPPGSF